MAEKLNVLVLESERGAADVAREELTAAGHNLVFPAAANPRKQQESEK